MRPIPMLTCLALGLLACSNPSSRPADTAIVETQPPELRSAAAVLSPAPNSNVSGTVTFTEFQDGVEVRISLKGLEPGSHGFHIHEKGDCSAPDFDSAGGHFNPEQSSHGDRTESVRHVGDLGNVTADSQGNVDLSFMDDRLALKGERSIVGCSVIVHAQPDDLLSQPAGNAGARQACGVITLLP